MRTRVATSLTKEGNLILKVAIQSPPDLYKGNYRPWLVIEFIGIRWNYKRHTWTRTKIMEVYEKAHKLYSACGYFEKGKDIQEGLSWTDVSKLTVMTDIQKFLPQFYSWHDYN